MAATRIQLCGRFVARVEGERIEERLPGPQGRVALAYLVLARHREVPRPELEDALWAERPRGDALSPLLSKLRKLVPLEGRSSLRLALEAWVDVEAAAEGLHRAEGAIARGDWSAAWGPARVAQHIAAREFLAGTDLPWAEVERRRLEEIHLRSLELVARACLGIGGGELDTAERAARALVAASPYHESGHRLLMEALAARGNRAESLVVFDALRRRLRDELGSPPSPETQQLHRQLLG